MTATAGPVRRYRLGTSIAVTIAMVLTVLSALDGVAAAATTPGPPTNVTTIAGPGQATVS